LKLQPTRTRVEVPDLKLNKLHDYKEPKHLEKYR